LFRPTPRAASILGAAALLACLTAQGAGAQADTVATPVAQPTAPVAATAAAAAAHTPATPSTTPSATAAPAAAPAAASSETGEETQARINRAEREGHHAEALAIAEAGLAARPRDAQLRFERAVILAELGRNDEAAADLEKLTHDFPELPEPYNNLAVLRAAQGSLAQAESLLRQALTVQPGYASARENLGDLYLALAGATYEQAAHDDAGNARVRRKLALTRSFSATLPARAEAPGAVAAPGPKP
jgi:Flp pilus assembly protein TadD